MLPNFGQHALVAGLAAWVGVLVPPPNPANAYTEQTLHSFCSLRNCTDGSEADGLAMDQSGNLYGVTYLGGANDAGLIYEFVPSTGQYTILYNFCSMTACADGNNPYRVRLVIDTSGNLYGTTSHGGSRFDAGVIFELKRSGNKWQESVLYAFGTRHPHKDGAQPFDGLSYFGAGAGHVYDGKSPLYGTTVGGGTNAAGTVFSVSLSAGGKKWREKVLYSFCSASNCSDGATPNTPLYIDGSGNVYGTTQAGGQFNNAGTVFELSPSGSAYIEATLYSFCALSNCTDGEFPSGGVIMDSTGNLIGTAGAGGSEGAGDIFELSPDGKRWDFSVLDNFTGSDGAGPNELIGDAAGNYFGTTGGGGTKDKGTIFEFDGSIISLYSFCGEKGCPDGRVPFSIVENPQGDIFGTTQNGGSNKGGTIYELSP